ncbi:MAG: peptide chain release factor N(5)-glutamine methyltransferase [Nitrospirota bacterium]
MKVLDKLKEATEFLKSYGIDEAGRDAELIISRCLEVDRMVFYRDNPTIPELYNAQIDEFLKRRSRREPLQYILGYAEFHGLKIKVGPGVLIPRPETELLVEEALEKIKSQELQISNKEVTLYILDLCTGSGCIALAMAKELPESRVYGIDSSKVAVEYAEENAKINMIKNVTFLKGNLFRPLEDLESEISKLEFHLILSNPPYIKKGDIRNLEPEIKDWEPVEALDGGEDGLDYFRAIIPGSKKYLKEKGYLILEIGAKQSREIKKIAEDADFKDIFLRNDYAGICRILVAKRIL